MFISVILIDITDGKKHKKREDYCRGTSKTYSLFGHIVEDIAWLALVTFKYGFPCLGYILGFRLDKGRFWTRNLGKINSNFISINLLQLLLLYTNYKLYTR